MTSAALERRARAWEDSGEILLLEEQGFQVSLKEGGKALCGLKTFLRKPGVPSFMCISPRTSGPCKPHRPHMFAELITRDAESESESSDSVVINFFKGRASTVTHK